MIVPCWTSPEGSPFATNGPARVWTHRIAGVTTRAVSLVAKARFFQEAGVAGQPLARCLTTCTSSGIRFETIGDPSWLQVDLAETAFSNDAEWGTSYPDNASPPVPYTPDPNWQYVRARAGLLGTFVHCWFGWQKFNPSNLAFLLNTDYTIEVTATGYIETEKWEQALFYDAREVTVLGETTCPSNDDIFNGPTGQRAERWDRVTFVHVDVTFSGAPIAAGFPATATLEFGTAGGSGTADSSVTAYPYPELTLTPKSAAYASATAFGNTVDPSHPVPCIGTAQATGASCPYTNLTGSITRDATTGIVTITNSENPGLNNFGALLMNQNGPVSLSYSGSVTRLGQPMTPTPVEFDIPGLDPFSEEFQVGDADGGLSFSRTWQNYVVREGRPSVDPASAILAQAGGPFPKAQIWLSKAWLHNPNYRSYPPGASPNGIDIVNDLLDYRIMAKGDIWDAMTLEHHQSLPIPGTWTAGGDAVFSGGTWSSASGTGYIYRNVSPTLDAEDYGKLKLPLTSAGAPAGLTLWVNKKTFDSTDGHEGKKYSIKTQTAGVEYDNLVNLCFPLNPLANTDEDSLTPPYTRTPDPGRDLQQSRWRPTVWKFGSTNSTVLSDNDGPYWGIGGGLTQLRIEGLIAGESYTIGDPSLVVDKTDTIDMVSGNGKFFTHRDLADTNNGIFGFTGRADGKQSGDWPHILNGTDATAASYNGVALDPAGIDPTLGASRHALHVCTITDLCNIINTSPAWIATPIATGHALNNADRPAACLNGMGALGGWNTDLKSGAVTIQACQLWDSIFDQGGSVSLEFVKVIGAAVAGVVTDGAGGPNAVDSVDEYAETDPLGVLDTWTLFGTGSTDADGKYTTGSPALVLRNNGESTITPTIICQTLEPSGIGSYAGSFGISDAVIDFQPIESYTGEHWQDYWIHRRRWRGAFRDTTGAGSLVRPWNLETEDGEYHRLSLLSGDVRYWRADDVTPRLGWALPHLQITSIGSVTSARMEQDFRGHTALLYADAAMTYEMVSSNGGKTWSAPVSRFTGTWPTIKRGGERLLLACYAGGNILMSEQYDGDDSPSPNWTLTDPDGTVLSVENDSFHLAYSERRSGGIWYLHVRILGEGHTSAWQSSDCRTWTRLGSDWQIAGGKHPTVMAGHVFGEVVWAAFVSGGLSCLLDYGGDTSPTAFTATGIALTDDVFSLAEAYEHAGRAVLAAVLSGDIAASESTSPNEGVSWQAV